MLARMTRDEAEVALIKASPEYKRLKALLGDPEWRLDNLYYIRNEEGTRVKFVRNEAQRAFQADMALRNVLPKARKLGFSTLIAIMICDRCVFRSNHVAGIVDITLDDATVKLSVIKYAYDNLPEDIRKANPLVRANDHYLEWANGSNVSVGTTYRGDTPADLHVCLTGDAGIYTANGIVKPISEVQAGDKVLTSSARCRTVRKVIKNKQADLGVSLLEVQTFGCPTPLKITENHRVLVRDQKRRNGVWRRAGALKRGDYLAIPIRNPGSNLRDGTVPYGESRARADWNLGWICGLYLAEGTTRRRAGNAPTEVLFSIDCDEVADVLAALEKVPLTGPLRTGKKRVRVYAHKSRTRVVSVNSRDLATFLNENFGAADEKNIPDKVWRWTIPFCRGLVKGYFDGDGSYRNLHVVSAVSTRRQIIDQLRLLLIALRYGVPAIYYSPAGVRYGRNCREQWTLKLGGSANWKFRRENGLDLPKLNTRSSQDSAERGWLPKGRKFWRRGRHVYWVRVTGVREIEPVEFVYDLALDVAPHNYLTVNGIVHNSEYGKVSADNPEGAREIKTGAIQAVPATGRIWVESTAHGTSGEFCDMVRRAQALADQRAQLTHLDFKFHFFGWWIKKEYRLPNNLVVVPHDLTHRYFPEVEAKIGRKLDADQRAWYAKKLEELGPDDIKSEFPSTADELFFVSLEGAYWREEISRARREERIGKPVPFDPTRSVNTFWDIGEDCTAIWWHQTDGVRHRFIDYWEEEGSSLQRACGVVDDKRRERGFVYGTHYGPHDLDHRDWAHESKTRKETAKGLGVAFEVVPKVPVKDDSIEAGRRLINLAWFCSERCGVGLSRLENYRKRWNKLLAQFTKDPLHDLNSHGSDALQQGAMGLKPEKGERESRSRDRRPPRTTSWSA